MYGLRTKQEKTEELSSVASLSSRIGVKESLRILWDLSALLTELEDNGFTIYLE